MLIPEVSAEVAALLVEVVEVPLLCLPLPVTKPI
jgi:hypothetical protein